MRFGPASVLSSPFNQDLQRNPFEKVIRYLWGLQITSSTEQTCFLGSRHVPRWTCRGQGCCGYYLGFFDQPGSAPAILLHACYKYVTCGTTAGWLQEKMLAGATARGISQTVLHPIDVVRTRLQVLNPVPLQHSSRSTAPSNGTREPAVSA
jgi:hypothetical protein